MRNKYASRKFLIGIGGLIISIVALLMGNNLISICGMLLAGLFIIGESSVDKASATKKTVTIHDTRTDKEVNNG